MTIVLVAGGTGAIGTFITKALVASKKFDCVLVLTRGRGESKAKAANLSTEGANIVTADYAKHASLVDALKGVDIVVCALNGYALTSQLPLIKAAKEAKVKRFVPSEYSLDPSRTPSTGFCKVQKEIQQEVKISGLEYIFYGTGAFTDADYTWVGIDIEKNKASIVGDGNTKISFTWREDIARFIAHTVSSPASKNKVLNIEGDAKTLNEVVQIVENKKGIKMDVTYTTVDKVVEAMNKAKASGDMGLMQEVQVYCATGLLHMSNPSVLSFQPKMVSEWLQANI